MVAKSQSKAARWYRKAAEQGDAMAQNNLGAMYMNGLGVKKRDLRAAAFWYYKAGEQDGHQHRREERDKPRVLNRVVGALVKREG